MKARVFTSGMALFGMLWAVQAFPQAQQPAPRPAPSQPPAAPVVLLPDKPELEPKALDVLKAASAELAAAHTMSFMAIATYESPARTLQPLMLRRTKEVNRDAYRHGFRYQAAAEKLQLTSSNCRCPAVLAAGWLRRSTRTQCDADVMAGIQRGGSA